MDHALLQAYRETEYRVSADTPIVLRVDQACAALAKLHSQHQVQCSAFITAYNPYSQRLDAVSNDLRQTRLQQALQRKGLATLPGIGQHPTNQWPAEISFLVLGIDLEAAKALALAYEQNAIIWSAADAVPQLVLLR